jgi:hypothetical protein
MNSKRSNIGLGTVRIVSLGLGIFLCTGTSLAVEQGQNLSLRLPDAPAVDCPGTVANDNTNATDHTAPASITEASQLDMVNDMQPSQIKDFVKDGAEQRQCSLEQARPKPSGFHSQNGKCEGTFPTSCRDEIGGNSN